MLPAGGGARSRVALRFSSVGDVIGDPVLLLLTAAIDVVAASVPPWRGDAPGARGGVVEPLRATPECPTGHAV